ncbi:MAG: ABC transporter permease [Propionibacteriaceae bacterium]
MTPVPLAAATLAETPPTDPSPSAPRGGMVRGFFSGLARSKVGFAGFILVALLIVMSIFGPLIFSHTRPTTIYWGGPTGQHWLGTNGQGQDTFSLVVGGGRTVLFVGFLAAAITVVIAVALGSLAAYFRGWFDVVMLQITDVVMTIPQIVLLAVLGAFFHMDSPTALAVLIGCLSWPVLMRSIRAQALSLKEREFVEAARLLDLGTARIVFVEIVPNMASFILINFIIAVTNAIYALVGLYLLGLAPLAGATWGIMIQDAWSNNAMFNPDAVAYILAPVAMIVFLQLGLILLTRSLEEILNPRLRDR